MVEKINTYKPTKFRLRKYETLELVELDAEDEDFEGEVSASKRKLRRGVGKTDFYTIFDLRDGSHIDKCTLEQKKIFFAACKKEERKNFLAVHRTTKRKDGETRYSLTHESGHHIEDISQKDLQTLVDKVPPSLMQKFKVVALREDEIFVAQNLPEKKKRVSGDVQNHRPNTLIEESETSTTDVSVQSSYMPELDTVRVYFDCGSLIDIDSFIPLTATKTVYLADRNVNGEVNKEKTFYRTEFACSWYGKMQITREERRFGKNAKYSSTVLSFEYSVAKWYNFTNGVNSGVEADAEYMLYPCVQAMCAYELDKYAWNPACTMHTIVSEFMQRAEIRRFDLSMNFKVPTALYKPREYVDLMARCRVNRQGAIRQDNEHHSCGSVSWGTEKSPYRVIVYDKEAEQKRYFSMKDGRRPFVWFEDSQGNKYKNQNSDGTLKECVYDFDAERQKFYNANKDKFDGVFRYEVQFKTKFMQENHLMTTGIDNINKVLRMGEVYWRDILNRFDEQIGRDNFDASQQREGLAKVLDRLSTMKNDGIISRTVYSNMFTFVTECMYRRWDVVRDELGKNLFSQKYRWVKANLNYDVKIECPKTAEGVPIMRIMPTLLLNHENELMHSFRFVPAPVYNIACGG